jgi:FKBP-type peptidyl-prolyl cis-trans isomerase SlyD
MNVVRKHAVVSMHYTLKDDSGAILDSTRVGGRPMVYLHGTDNMLAGLEAELEGKSAGQNLKIVLPPENGFGVVDPALMQHVPIELFDGMKLEIGSVFGSQSDAHQMRTVTAIHGNTVTLNANHPLAGKTLYFDVEILFVRAATSHEIEHGLA